MNPLWDYWFNLFRSPLSGNVEQNYHPVTSWWSPQFEFNFAGDQHIEAQVVSNIASYGRQLGMITEAVLALAENNDSPAIEKLRKLADKIENVKNEHSRESIESLESQLRKLKESDRAAFDKLLSQLKE